MNDGPEKPYCTTAEAAKALGYTVRGFKLWAKRTGKVRKWKPAGGRVWRWSTADVLEAQKETPVIRGEKELSPPRK